MQIEATSQVDFVIEDILIGNHKYGTFGQKVTDLFKCIVDSETRNLQGVEPIKKYLNMIDDARNISELTNLEYVISEELCVSSFMGFSLGIDMNDSSKYVLNFGKYTGKTLPEIAEIDKGYIAWAKENMTREPVKTLLAQM